MPTTPGLSIALFQTDVMREARTHRWDPNVVSDLTALATALGTDPSVKDTTLQTAPTALIPGYGKQPGVTPHSRLVNDVLLHVNEGKASGLTAAAMGSAITSALTNILPPTSSAAPVASGTGTVGQTLSVTNGTWNFAPVSYRYQWQRAGLAIPGAINPTYIVQTADTGGNLITCMVAASNQAGFGTAVSNGISVA
jgi:hypothetical protein